MTNVFPMLMADDIVRDYRYRKSGGTDNFSYRGGRKISYYGDSGLEIDNYGEE